MIPLHLQGSCSKGCDPLSKYDHAIIQRSACKNELVLGRFLDHTSMIAIGRSQTIR